MLARCVLKTVRRGAISVLVFSCTASARMKACICVLFRTVI